MSIISVQVQQQDQAGRDDCGLMTTTSPPKPSEFQLFDAVRVGNPDLLNQLAGQFDVLHTRTPSGETVLHVAAEFNQVECVKLILSLYPKLERWTSDQWDTALHIAARWGHVEIVQLLLAAAKTESSDEKQMISWLRRTNRKKYTALHDAVFYRHLHVVEILLKEDPDADWEDSDIGESPLYLAAARGFEDVALLMMRFSASDKLYQPNRSDERNPLQAAIVSNLPGVTAQILKRMPDLAGEGDKDGWTPLHWAACCDSWTLSVAQLLSFDPSLAYKKAKKSITPFHVAASASSIKRILHKLSTLLWTPIDEMLFIMQLLAETKKRSWPFFKSPWFSKHLNDRDIEGNTALHLLVSSGHSHLMPLLTNHSEIDLFVVNDKHLTVYEIQQTRQHEVKCEVQDDDKWWLHPRFRGPFTDERIFDFDTYRKNLQRKTYRQKYEEELREEKKKRDSFLEKVGQSHLVVAALIATVTFAAGFTLPGGYNDEGKAILLKKAAFVVFIISDATALALSLLAVFVYFICATAQDPSDEKYYVNIQKNPNEGHWNIIDILQKSLHYYEKLYRYGINFTMLSIFATTIAFMSGVYVTFSDSVVTIIVLAISGLSLATCSIIYYKRYMLSASIKKV